MAPIKRNGRNEAVCKISEMSFGGRMGSSLSRFNHPVLVLIWVLLVTGCTTMTTYDGPKRSKDQIAILDARQVLSFWSVGGNSIEIESIDNKSTGTFTENIELLPGLHTVQFVYNVCSVASYFSCIDRKYRGSLQFRAEAGHVYKIDEKIQNNVVRYWIKDADTADIVAEMSCRRQMGENFQLTDCTPR